MRISIRDGDRTASNLPVRSCVKAGRADSALKMLYNGLPDALLSRLPAYPTHADLRDGDGCDESLQRAYTGTCRHDACSHA